MWLDWPDLSITIGSNREPGSGLSPCTPPQIADHYAMSCKRKDLTPRTNVGVAFLETSMLYETQKMAAQKASESFAKNILQHTPGNAARFVAAVDLLGGWDALVTSFNADWNKPAPVWPQPLPYVPPKNGPRGN